MRTTAGKRPEPAAVSPGPERIRRNYPVLPSMPLPQAMAKVMELCKYDEAKARAALAIARRVGPNAEPAPNGLINITYIAGAYTIENRQA